jgi:hypothetical protein
MGSSGKMVGGSYATLLSNQPSDPRGSVSEIPVRVRPGACWASVVKYLSLQLVPMLGCTNFRQWPLTLHLGLT